VRRPWSVAGGGTERAAAVHAPARACGPRQQAPARPDRAAACALRGRATPTGAAILQCTWASLTPSPRAWSRWARL